MSELINTDRSRIENYEKCPRLRYWRYEHDGTGVEPSDERSLRLDARIGTGVHDGIEHALMPASSGMLADYRPLAALSAGVGSGAYMRKIAEDGIDYLGLPEQTRADVLEGAQIVQALVYAWVMVRLPSLLREGSILAVEREMNVDFEVGEKRVRLMTRPDIIWRRNADGATFIRNLKTVREPRGVWREQWALDMQTLTEPLAVDKWLAENIDPRQGAPGAVCSGVIIDGLITGPVLDYPRGSGKFYHNSPLLWAWVRKGDPPFGIDEWYPKYEWSCGGPHKMGNGRRCEGGKVHKLAGARKESTSGYPGGLIAWIDHLLEEDESAVQDQIVELPPIMRSPYAIERWKRQTLMREVDIHQAAHGLLPDDHDFDAYLDEHFPMHTASGNCLRPGKCMAYNLCHGTAAADPYAANYRARQPHHPQEGQP